MKGRVNPCSSLSCLILRNCQNHPNLWQSPPWSLGCHQQWSKTLHQQKDYDLGFPGGSVVKNPPASAGDRGSIPDPGRSGMLWSNWAHRLQLLSLCSRAQEPQLLSPCATATEAIRPQSPCSETREAITERNLSAATRNSPYFLQLEKSPSSNKDPAQQNKY